MPTKAQTPTDQFLTFVRRSREILARRGQLRTPVEAFQSFVAAATPLVLPRLKSSLPLLVSRAKLVHRWLVKDDILEVAGLSGLENPYTELVAWLLSPHTHPATAMKRQMAWLRILGLADHINLLSPAIPRTQLRTDDGIADLILDYRSPVVVVETKTNTVEHAAPSGAPQTIAYAQSVARRLGLGDTKVFVVFLTPDGQAAANPDAIATTFAKLVVALATEIAPAELPADLRWAFATIFTHLLAHTGVVGGEIHALLEQVAPWEDDRALLETDSLLMARLKTIQQAMQILLPEPKS